jgi:hypothetical protein
MNKSVLLLAIVISLLGAVNWASERPVERDPGVLIEREPRQTHPASTAPIAHGDYRITPLAEFELEARVLSREDYALDAGADLVPTDLALGWGRMSDTQVIEQLNIEQSARFYSYRWSDRPPIPPQEIVRSSANMHLIPADDRVAEQLDQVRVGALIALRGQLVTARRADGWTWTSSLTRTDSGGGACELVLVQAITVL